jgi:hypothetical protein
MFNKGQLERIEDYAACIRECLRWCVEPPTSFTDFVANPDRYAERLKEAERCEAERLDALEAMTCFDDNGNYLHAGYDPLLSEDEIPF